MSAALDALRAKIASQQAKEKEGSPVIMVGMQLLDMAAEDPRCAELLLHDLDVAEMDLTNAAGKIKEYADKNHKGSNCFCVTPMVAEKILREFYGLPEADAKDPTRDRDPGLLNLTDFL